MRPRGRACVRADTLLCPRGRALFYPGYFKKDFTVRPSHGRPRGHRSIVRPSGNVRVITMIESNIMQNHEGKKVF
jgi:hypothetical protein